MGFRNKADILLLEEAILLAVTVHRGQIRKNGTPFIFHPLRVMLRMDSVEEMITGILHDTIEDGHVTLEQLERMGFSLRIREAVDCLTHKEEEPYMDYIKRVKGNHLATRVKIADLRDNMNMGEIPNPGQRDHQRLQKYQKALRILTTQ